MEFGMMMFLSALTYMMLRCLEEMGKAIWDKLNGDRDDEIQRLVDVIEEYKRQLDEAHDDKEAK